MNKVFDYESAPNTLKFDVAGTELYVHEPGKIMRSIVNEGDKKFYVDDSHYSLGSLSTSMLTSQWLEKGTDENHMYYNSEIQVGSNRLLNNQDYFKALRELATDTPFGIYPTTFLNQYLIHNTDTHTLLLASAHSDKAYVQTSNETGQMGNSTFDGYAHQLRAPRINAGMGEQLKTQFFHTIQAHILSINALSLALDDKKLHDVYVVTPEGQYHPTKTQLAKHSIIDMAQPAPINTEKPAPQLEEKPLQAIEAKKDKAPKERRSISLDDLGGLESIRNELKELAFSFNHQEEMQQWGAERSQGVLLWGPPGTGKTSLAYALANEIDGEVWEIKGSQIFGKYVGDSEKNMTDIFKAARKKEAPTVMLFDEFEALLDSSPRGGSTMQSVVGIFKKETSALREKNPNIILFATTNHKDRIDESLIRAGRFDTLAYIPLPDESARQQIFGKKIAEILETLQTDEFTPIDPTIDIQRLAQLTEEKSGADINEIFRRAKFEKAMEAAKSANGYATPISQNELENLIQNMRTR